MTAAAVQAALPWRARLIDTLRFVEHLEQKGKFTPEQAKAIAQGFAQEAREDFATKRDLDVLHWKIVATVALLLLVHLAAVWGIVASVAGG